MTAALEDRAPFARKVLAFVALAAAGGLVGYVASTLTDGLLSSWEDEAAVLIAAILIGAGVISAVVAAVRPALVPKGCGALQSAVLLLAGLLFLLPVFGARWAAPHTVFAVVVAVLALQGAANLMLWRAADEMLRRIMTETGALAFWALQLALFIYAAAERLGLVETISAWGLMGVLMGVYLIASMIAAARRGVT